jgi:UDP-N-acetylmuramoyl-tripeptide--D-alanyl-D-alanine ligase
MRAAFAVLAAARPAPGGRRLAVIGDMRELGEQAPELHRALLPDLEAAEIAHLFSCGPLMRHLADAAAAAGMTVTHAASAASLAPAVIASVRPGDVVLVKGSLGSRMADIVRPLLASNQEGAVAGC